MASEGCRKDLGSLRVLEVSEVLKFVTFRGCFLLLVRLREKRGFLFLIVL